jgi:two-component system LytT family response regulator
LALREGSEIANIAEQNRDRHLPPGGVRRFGQGRAESLAQRLDPSRFARVHRSAIVKLARIREIRVAARGDHTLVLDDATRLRLTRGRRRDLEALIESAPG